MGHIILFDIENLIATYGYVGISLVIFFESGIFFALPGDSLLFTAGLVAAASKLNIYILIPLIFAATYLGGIAGYFIGVYIEKLHNYKLFRKILKPEHLKRAHEFFEQHGKFAIILSRFVPIVRTFTPIVAGAAEMDKASFMKYSLVSSILWSVSITSAGYFLGRELPFLRHYLTEIIIVIVILSVLPVILKWRKRGNL